MVDVITFRNNGRSVAIMWGFLLFLILVHVAKLVFTIYRVKDHGMYLEIDALFLCGYLALGSFLVYHIRTSLGQRIEVTDTEIKLINRDGNVIKSRRFVEITELRLGTDPHPPRRHHLVFAGGKDWIIDFHCENVDALARLIEERTGQSFVEPIARD